jgi:hypothetical protein
MPDMAEKRKILPISTAVLIAVRINPGFDNHLPTGDPVAWWLRHS